MGKDCGLRTQVCITVDTEFSIGGAFASAARSPVGEPAVWCDVGGRSEGLGFLLDCLRRHGIAATFFIEALHRTWFRLDPMRPIARRIADEGHELQLHVHPCWSVFRHPDWRERVRLEPRQDDFFGRPEEESLALIREGQEIFRDWELPAPRAFRSGSLQHDDALYRALARAGIPYSSSVGLAIFNSADARYQLYSGCHERHGVVECPVLTFRDWRLGGCGHLKSLTIAGTSFEETRTLLERAEEAGIPLVVILTHPFEFIQHRDAAFRQVRRHAVNQHRLELLCGFLKANRSRFAACGFADAVDRLGGRALSGNALVEGQLWQAAGRMASQVFYDTFGQLALLKAYGGRSA